MTDHERQIVAKQPGTCLQCHSSVISPPGRAAGATTRSRRPGGFSARRSS
jgi:hypothetical protein